MFHLFPTIFRRKRIVVVSYNVSLQKDCIILVAAEELYRRVASNVCFESFGLRKRGPVQEDPQLRSDLAPLVPLAIRRPCFLPDGKTAVASPSRPPRRFFRDETSNNNPIPPTVESFWRRPSRVFVANTWAGQPIRARNIVLACNPLVLTSKIIGRSCTSDKARDRLSPGILQIMYIRRNLTSR